MSTAPAPMSASREIFHILSFTGYYVGLALLLLLFPVAVPILLALAAGVKVVSARSFPECIRLVTRRLGFVALSIGMVALFGVHSAAQSSGWMAVWGLWEAIAAFGFGAFAAGLVIGALERTGLFSGIPQAAAVASGPRAASAGVQSASHHGAINVPDDLKDRLAATIRGQDVALEEISEALLTSAMKYGSGKPLGMYLLVGATGSGKTETAKRLAAILGWPMHREECSQYSTQHGITRLIGAAAGYVDSETGGSLTNALRASPHGVLLLDEIEKADPSVSRALMTLADEGTITTARGEVVDARGWIILATSNASQAEIIRLTEDTRLSRFARVAQIKQKLAEHWPAEIVARMRSVVPYRPLSDEVMKTVFVDMVIEQVTIAGGTADHFVFVDDGAMALLEDAYKSLRAFGVREMRNVVARDLELPLMRLLRTDALDLVVSAHGDRLVVAPKPGGRTKGATNAAKGLLSKIGFGR